MISKQTDEHALREPCTEAVDHKEEEERGQDRALWHPFLDGVPLTVGTVDPNPGPPALKEPLHPPNQAGVNSFFEYAVQEIGPPDLVVGPAEVKQGKDRPIGLLFLLEPVVDGLGQSQHLV